MRGKIYHRLGTGLHEVDGIKIVLQGDLESIRTLHINILFPPTQLIRAIQIVSFDGRLLPPRCLCGPGCIQMISERFG